MKPWPQWYCPPAPARTPLDVMFKYVADHYQVTPAELRGRRRHTSLVNGRSVIAKILRERGHSYPAIARMIGKRDHTTIFHLLNTYDVRAKHNPDMSLLYTAIKEHEAAMDAVAA